MTPIRWTGTENTGRPGCWRVGVRNMARVCSWCDRPLSEQDAEAIRENPDITRSHGICPSCRALHFAGLAEADEPKPAA